MNLPENYREFKTIRDLALGRKTYSSPENGTPWLGQFLLAVIGIAGALSLIGFWSTGFAVFVVGMWVISSLMVLVAGWSEMLNESISRSDWKSKVRHAKKDYRAALDKNETLRELEDLFLKGTEGIEGYELDLAEKTYAKNYAKLVAKERTQHLSQVVDLEAKMAGVMNPVIGERRSEVQDS